MKKLFIIPLMLFTVSCGGGNEPSPTPSPTEDLTESVTNENMIHYIGRKNIGEKSVDFAMTCSGFEVKVNVTDANNKLTANLTSSVLSGFENQYAYVFIDGVEPTSALQLPNETTKDFVLTENLTLGEHYIRFCKLNEACYTRLTLNDLTFTGATWCKWDKTYAKRIEFYGDSITCGYGCDGQTSQNFSMETENGCHTYGYTCAEDLGYEPSFCSQSGISLYMNAWDSPIHFENIYNTLDCETSFDTSKHKVDIAVIALGTNDNTKFVTLNAQQQATEIENIFAKYKELVTQIKTNNPKCQFFLIYNLMVTQNGYLDTALLGTNNYLNDTYGAGTSYLYEFGPDFKGCDGHPGKEAHIKDGHILSEFIKNPYDINE